MSHRALLGELAHPPPRSTDSSKFVFNTIIFSQANNALNRRRERGKGREGRRRTSATFLIVYQGLSQQQALLGTLGVQAEGYMNCHFFQRVTSETRDLQAPLLMPSPNFLLEKERERLLSTSEAQ